MTLAPDTVRIARYRRERSWRYPGGISSVIRARPPAVQSCGSRRDFSTTRFEKAMYFSAFLRSKMPGAQSATSRQKRQSEKELPQLHRPFPITPNLQMMQGSPAVMNCGRAPTVRARIVPPLLAAPHRNRTDTRSSSLLDFLETGTNRPKGLPISLGALRTRPIHWSECTVPTSDPKIPGQNLPRVAPDISIFAIRLSRVGFQSPEIIAFDSQFTVRWCR